MSEHELPPLPSHLRGLLDAERDVPAAARAPGRERVRRALDASLFGSPGGGGGEDGGGGGGGGGAPDAGGAGGAAQVATPLSRLGSLGIAAIVGAVAGAAITYGAMSSQGSVAAPASSAVTSAVAASAVAAPLVPSAALSFSASSPAVVSVASVAPIASASAGAAHRDLGADSANAERAILDPARAALARGDATTALEATRAHESAFPGGKLAEEREAIAVQALVRLHRGAAAKQRGARFLAKYPSSVLAPVVQAALANAD